jgi:hypothetical protein
MNDGTGAGSARRQCGQCTLCCRLLPQAEIAKPANQRCQHQRHTGCKIYSKRPHSCRIWSCEWLLGAPLRRPDFGHFVVDIMPDFITATREGEAPQRIPVVQVWVDPRHPDAYNDPGLRAYLAERGESAGMAALIRYSSDEGFVLFPPALTGGHWVENRDGIRGKQHTAEEVLAAVPEHLTGAMAHIAGEEKQTW